jgi:hypothetical protein
MTNQHEPASEPDVDPIIAAMWLNAGAIAELRRDAPTERSAQLTEWLSSEGWRRLIALVRSEQWERLSATIDALEVEAARTAIRWAVIELSRLEA